MKKSKPVKSAAVVTIRRSSEMTPKGRKAVATWLRRQAFTLEHHGNILAPTFTARYLY